MYVYVVTHKKLEAYKVGEYRNLHCYQMGFLQYRHLDERGYVFPTAAQALNFMLKRRY